jgi:NTP pyrophosphatase (non-canonical NTP hydrolase)
VLWYCAVLAKEMEMDLGHIMESNLQKLADRKKRGTLSGSGDNR